MSCFSASILDMLLAKKENNFMFIYFMFICSKEFLLIWVEWNMLVQLFSKPFPLLLQVSDFKLFAALPNCLQTKSDAFP